MNHFAPGALLARSVLAFPHDEEPIVREETLFLSRLFKREFVYKHGIDFSAGYAEASQILIDIGYVHRTNNMLHPTDDVSLRQLAHLLDNFIEAYWCTACALRELHAFPMWQKELETRAFEGGRRAFLEGIIRRPEATSGILIKGALDSFTRMGVIRIDTRENKAHVQLTEAYAEAELEKFITHIARFLAS
jgi:glycerol-3-phosphate O-acyltransferase